MLVSLKLHKIYVLKVVLTHPDNGVGSQITPAGMYFCLP